MSLLATASPYNSGNENNDNENLTSRRQQSHNRTLKQRKPNNNNNDEEEVIPMRPNVAAMMKALNNVPEEDGTGLADFNPPSKAELSKVPNNNNKNLNANSARQGFTNLAQAAPYEYDMSNTKINNMIPKANDDRAIDLSLIHI